MRHPVVENMQPQGNAFLSGLIDVGDEVVEINTKSFLDTNLKDGIEFMKNVPTGPVRFLTRKKRFSIFEKIYYLYLYYENITSITPVVM